MLERYRQWRAERATQALLNELEILHEQTAEMTCEEVQARLADYVAAEFSGKDADRAEEFVGVSKHLNGCPDCTDLYADLSEKVQRIIDAGGAV